MPPPEKHKPKIKQPTQEKQSNAEWSGKERSNKNDNTPQLMAAAHYQPPVTAMPEVEQPTDFYSDFEPGVRATLVNNTLKVEEDNKKVTYDDEDITKLTAYEKIHPPKDQIKVTFFEKENRDKIPVKDRKDFAKLDKYKTKGEIHTGMTKADSLNLKFNVSSPRGNSGSKWSTVTKSLNESQFPVFAKSGPSPNDIKQSVSGQCWALAALASIARQPSQIKAMIPVSDENSVTVRFFHNDGSPELVKISRMVQDVSFFGLKMKISSKTGSENSSWPILILKAYAAWGGRGDEEQSYQSLDGGHSSDAFIHFLGSNNYDVKTVSTNVMENGGGRIKAPWEKNTRTPDGNNAHVLAWIPFFKLLEAASNLERKDLIGRKGQNLYFQPDVEKWVKYSDSDPGKYLKVDAGVDLGLTLEYINNHIKKAGISGTITGNAILKAWGQKIGHGGGKEFENLDIKRYSEKQVKIYNDILSVVKNDGYAAAGTKGGKFVGGDGKVKGGRSAILKGGLQKQHAYSILDIRAEKSGAINVELRNPWGSRKIVGGDAIFKLEFSKFLRRFDNIYLASKKLST
jgi:hypothetical protein